MRTRGVRLIALSLITVITAHASSAQSDPGPIGGGLTSAPASVADSLPGVPIPCSDVRTGTPFEFRAQRLLIAGLVDTSWAPDSTRLCLGSLVGLRQRMVTDGSGGAFVGWVDNRTGDGDIYLQRFTAEGAIAPGWPADGLAVCGERLSQYHLDLASDGTGGVWLAWEDYRAARDGDIFVQRIGASGEPAAGWPAGGFPVCARAGQQSNPRIVGDGTGGAFVVWEDRRHGAVELHAQRLSGVPVCAGGWPAEGAALGTGRAVAPVLAADSLGRVIVLWKALAAPGVVELRGARVPAEGPVGSWPPATYVLSSGVNELGEVAVSRLGSDLVAAWAEWRGTDGAVRAQRLSITGDIAPQWSEGGAIAHAGAPGRGAPAVLGCAGGVAPIRWTGEDCG